MKDQEEKHRHQGLQEDAKRGDSLRDSLEYPASEDIYIRRKEEADIDPEDITKAKAPNDNDVHNKSNERDFTGNMSGGDLDIPGNEMDEAEVNPGNEDEENNLYSLGGDEHNNLDED